MAMKAVCALVLAVGVVLGSDVVVGTSKNFDEVVGGDGTVLVEFYAPWCGHCKRLAPEWEKAATELKGKATLVKVDATEEGELASKYEVQGYPTIKAWLGGSGPVEYDGGRSAADIVGWVKKMSGPAVSTVGSGSELEDLKKEHRVLVAGFFSGEDDDEAKAFGEMAKKHRASYAFAAVYGGEDHGEGVKAPGVAVFKQFDDGKEVFKGEYEADKVLDFIKAASFELLGEIGPDNYRDYVGRGLPMAWLFVDPSETEATEKAKDAVRSVAGKFKGKMSMIWLSGVQYGQMAGRVGLSGKKWPALGIDDQGEHYAFDENAELEAEALEKFFQGFIDGTLEPTIKSEDAPEEPTKNGVTTLVGSTFKDIVMDEKKNVFIKFYAPWCGHCKSMIPAFEELGKEFEDDDSVIIAKMDATANDPPKGFKVEGFPTLMFVKAGSNEILNYNGGRDAKDMSSYIKENKA